MLARSDWLESYEWHLHGENESQEVEGGVSNVDPVCSQVRDNENILDKLCVFYTIEEVNE